MPNESVAIIGAGFSGTLLAVHLLRQCNSTTRIRLIDPAAVFGPGLAYGTDNHEHLLNVPAGRMSAFHDEPSHFLDWLRRARVVLEDGTVPQASSFAPRHYYGQYLRALLAEAQREGAPHRLELVRGRVVEIEHADAGVALRFHDRPPMTATMAVIATGNHQPAPPPCTGHTDCSVFRNDPWSENAFTGVPTDAAVLLIGTGLTMVDAVLHLLVRGHGGPIHALSRRGLCPRMHTSLPSAVPPHDFPRALRPLIRFVRAEADRITAAGGTWQSVIDAIRPITQDLWQGWSVAERHRFLCHLRPYWDVHRHRVAPPIGERIEAARASGQLTVRAGHINGVVTHGNIAEVAWRPRGTTGQRTLHVQRIVNCTGPASDVTRSDDPLLCSLLSSGLARPDPLRLGLDVTASGAVIARDGVPSRRLFGIGPVCRGALWEITAVPDIRRQCPSIACQIADTLREHAVSG